MYREQAGAALFEPLDYEAGLEACEDEGSQACQTFDSTGSVQSLK